MESLALLATIILLVTLVVGGVSAVAAVRRPRHRSTRTLAITCGVVAGAAGLNLARLDIAMPARAFGVLVAAAGIAAVVRSVRSVRSVAPTTDPDEEHR